jgi:hypothetical protein
VNVGWNIITDINTDKIVKATREWMPTSSQLLSSTSNQIKPIFGNGQTSMIIKDLITSFQAV